MISTGIVRRIDDLGRVVIPKELRKAINISEGDPLEFYRNNEGDLIIKKYKPSQEEQTVIALENALDFLEELPAPPVDIIEEIHKALEIEY